MNTASCSSPTASSSQVRDRTASGHGGNRGHLRRFTKKNLQHPTYKAFAELGKATKTIFPCRYLHDEALRREINEG